MERIQAETQGHLPECVWAWRQEIRFSWQEPSCPGGYVCLVCVPVSPAVPGGRGWLPEAKLRCTGGWTAAPPRLWSGRWGPEVGQARGTGLWPLTILPQTPWLSHPTRFYEALRRAWSISLAILLSGPSVGEGLALRGQLPDL